MDRVEKDVAGRVAAVAVPGGTLTVSALGDSLTYGYMVPEGYLDGVEAGLRRAFPSTFVRVHNHGVCGDTVFDGLERVGRAFHATLPDAGLVQFGLNDCFSGLSPARFARGLAQLLEECRRALPRMGVVLVPPPPVREEEFDRAALPFRDAMEEAAEAFGASCARVSPLWGREAAGEPLWLADGVHPTVAGYRRMATAVLEALGVPAEVAGRVRGHHLLCLPAFSGEGYSEGFVGEFGRLAGVYRRPGKLVRVVWGPDDACRACPHLGPDGCTSAADGPEAAVAELDSAVIAALGIGPGTYESAGLLARVAGLSPAVVDELCSRCSWYGKTDCQERLMRLGPVQE